MAQYPNYPRANVLVCGSNAIQALLPSTLISQADALLLAHRLEDVSDLAEQRRKKLQSMLNAEPHEVCVYLSLIRPAHKPPSQLDELRYVNQRLGFQCFTETRFEDAGNRLFEGELDPRVLVSYYPELRGKLFSEDDAVDVMAGVAEHMPQEDSVDDISEFYNAPRPSYDRICAIAFPICIPPSASPPSPCAPAQPVLLLGRGRLCFSFLCGALTHSPPIDFALYPTPVPPLAISRRD